MFLSRIIRLTISAAFETCNAPVISLAFNNAGPKSSLKIRKPSRPFLCACNSGKPSRSSSLNYVACNLDVDEPS